MFSQVFVCPRGGGGLPHCMLGYTPRQVHPRASTPSWTGTSPGQVHRPVQIHPPRQVQPPGKTPPPSQCMLGYTPFCPVHAGIHTPRLCAMHAWIRSTSGPYAFHWNAFLFSITFKTNVLIIYLCFQIKFSIGHHCKTSQNLLKCLKQSKFIEHPAR